MEEYKNINRKEIEEKLLGENLKVNRIISLSLCIGASLFLLVVIFLYQKNLSSNLEIMGDKVVDTLIIVLTVIAIGVYAFFFIFPKIYLKKENLEKLLSEPSIDRNRNLITDPILKIIGIDRTVMIIRLTLLEGITLFALVALMQSVQSGIIYQNSNYWLLTIPLLILVIVVLTNFISKEKIISRIENDILFKLLRNH